ncbi:hypothetical protein [Nesterenkonia muleiensis]|uniref:hypothetical protein n=1 Tax=Nesterenkonia muleiensis TaxID=2282648 RepID=UPI000E72E8A2|nr:hypothetical protein [Nesterenkonia muleiensis]
MEITDLRLSDDETTLLGDWINAPEDLADKPPSAYPNRSMEATFNMELKDETGEVTESYPAVLTALALLGATAPAVKNLAQIHASFSADGHKVFASGGTSVRITTSLPGGLTGNALSEALRAALRGLEPDDAWYWLMDWTDEHVYYRDEDDTGGIYRHDYTVTSSGVIEFTGTPVPVKAAFIPAEPDGSAPAQTVPHSNAALSDSGTTDASNPVANPANDQGEPRMWTDQDPRRAGQEIRSRRERHRRADRGSDSR